MPGVRGGEACAPSETACARASPPRANANILRPSPRLTLRTLTLTLTLALT